MKFKLLTPQEYLAELMANIPRATSRITIHAMNIAWQPTATQTLIPLLYGAIDRGVKVTIVGDVFTKYDFNTRHDWSHTQAVNRQLQAKGAHITYVGKLGLNPYKRRCHTKITIVDSTVYSFGGINVMDCAFTGLDYMLRVSSATLADQMQQLVADVARNIERKDLLLHLDNHNHLLYDSGKPRASIIYETACALAAHAKTTYYISQYPPSGPLSSLLRKTKHHIYHTRPGQTDPISGASIVLDNIRNRLPNQYTHQPYLHAKCILFQNQDGSKSLITGSHNFSWRGVAYGTKEIALYSTDEDLWQQLYSYLQEHIQ